MNAPPTQRSRPLAEPAPVLMTPTVSPQDTPTGHDEHPHAGQVRGCLVLVVETPGGRYRRRTFLTLASAERACRKAREAGHAASVTVAQLVPVAVVV